MPEVVRTCPLSMQVCVPAEWTDKQVTLFAESKNPCGTQLGWVIRKQSDPMLAGSPERNPCSKGGGNVHITLDA